MRGVAIRGSAEIQKAKTENERSRLNHEQTQQRERPKIPNECLSQALGANSSREAAPWTPRGEIEQAREPEPTRDAPGQDNRFERFPQDDDDDEKPDDARKESCSLLQVRVHRDFRFQEARDRAICFCAGGG